MSFLSALAALRPDPQHHRTRAARRRARTRPRLELLDDRCLLSADVVLEWNQVVLDTLKADHLLPVLGPQAGHGREVPRRRQRHRPVAHAALRRRQGAPRRLARGRGRPRRRHDTLVALSRRTRETLDATLDADLAGIPPGRASWAWPSGRPSPSRSWPGGAPTARTSRSPTSPVTTRATGSRRRRPSRPPWRRAVGAGHPVLHPRRHGVPPAAAAGLDQHEYTAAFEEVKSLGAPGSTSRTAEQSDIAQFWYGTAGTTTFGRLLEPDRPGGRRAARRLDGPERPPVRPAQPGPGGLLLRHLGQPSIPTTSGAR